MRRTCHSQIATHDEFDREDALGRVVFNFIEPSEDLVWISRSWTICCRRRSIGETQAQEERKKEVRVQEERERVAREAKAQEEREKEAKAQEEREKEVNAHEERREQEREKLRLRGSTRAT